MTAKPNALRLAEQLEAIGLHGPVAAELRRLHAQRDAMLEALKVVIDDLMYQNHARVIDVARAAIAKAEEKQ